MEHHISRELQMELASLRIRSFDIFFFFLMINLARKTLALYRSCLFTTKVLCHSSARVPVEGTSKLLPPQNQSRKGWTACVQLRNRLEKGSEISEVSHTYGSVL